MQVAMAGAVNAVYAPNGQAIVFTKQMAAYAGWVVLERDGTSWTITHSTSIAQS